MEQHLSNRRAALDRLSCPPGCRVPERRSVVKYAGKSSGNAIRERIAFSLTASRCAESAC